MSLMQTKAFFNLMVDITTSVPQESVIEQCSNLTVIWRELIKATKTSKRLLSSPFFQFVFANMYSCRQG